MTEVTKEMIDAGVEASAEEFANTYALSPDTIRTIYLAMRAKDPGLMFVRRAALEDAAKAASADPKIKRAIERLMPIELYGSSE